MTTLEDLKALKITGFEVKPSTGKQVKVIVTLEGGKRYTYKLSSFVDVTDAKTVVNRIFKYNDTLEQFNNKFKNEREKSKPMTKKEEVEAKKEAKVLSEIDEPVEEEEDIPEPPSLETPEPTAIIEHTPAEPPLTDEEKETLMSIFTTAGLDTDVDGLISSAISRISAPPAITKSHPELSLPKKERTVYPYSAPVTPYKTQKEVNEAILNLVSTPWQFYTRYRNLPALVALIRKNKSNSKFPKIYRAYSLDELKTRIR